MSYLRFNHVFLGLMGLGAITAFAVPSRFLQARIPAVEILFAPVSRPTGAIARWAHDKFDPELSPDQRAVEDVKVENQMLRDEVSNLATRVAELDRINKERNLIDVRDLCTPYPVIGSDTGARSSLAIGGSSLQGLRENMKVLYKRGIAGVVERSGVGGARVQLITDLGFRVRVSFVRFDAKGKPVPIKHAPTLVEGTGKGVMVIRSLTREDVQETGLQVDDSVVLDEPDWAANLQGKMLGTIAAIGPREGAPLWDAITVKPPQNLMLLREVMIVTKE